MIGRAVQLLANAGTLIQPSGCVALAGWEPTPSPEQEKLMESVMSRLRLAGAEPPGIPELNAELGSDVAALVKFLERSGAVVQVEAERYYAADQLKLLLDRLRQSMPNGAEFSPSQIRDSLDLSRKFLIPFLEYCDRAGFTVRSATGRSWRGS